MFFGTQFVCLRCDQVIANVSDGAMAIYNTNLSRFYAVHEFCFYCMECDQPLETEDALIAPNTGRLVCEKDYIQELLNPALESADDVTKGYPNTQKNCNTIEQMTKLQEKYPEYAKLFLQVQNVYAKLANPEIILDLKENKTIKMDDGPEDCLESIPILEFPIAMSKLDDCHEEDLSSTLSKIKDEKSTDNLHDQLLLDLNGNSQFTTRPNFTSSTPNPRQQNFPRLITKLDIARGITKSVNLMIDSPGLKISNFETKEDLMFGLKRQNLSELQRDEGIFGLSDTGSNLERSTIELNDSEMTNKLFVHLSIPISNPDEPDQEQDDSRDDWSSTSYSQEVIYSDSWDDQMSPSKSVNQNNNTSLEINNSEIESDDQWQEASIDNMSQQFELVLELPNEENLLQPEFPVQLFSYENITENSNSATSSFQDDEWKYATTTTQNEKSDEHSIKFQSFDKAKRDDTASFNWSHDFHPHSVKLTESFDSSKDCERIVSDNVIEEDNLVIDSKPSVHQEIRSDNVKSSEDEEFQSYLKEQRYSRNLFELEEGEKEEPVCNTENSSIAPTIIAHGLPLNEELSQTSDTTEQKEVVDSLALKKKEEYLDFPTLSTCSAPESGDMKGESSNNMVTKKEENLDFPRATLSKCPTLECGDLQKESSNNMVIKKEENLDFPMATLSTCPTPESRDLPEGSSKNNLKQPVQVCYPPAPVFEAQPMVVTSIFPMETTTMSQQKSSFVTQQINFPNPAVSQVHSNSESFFTLTFNKFVLDEKLSTIKGKRKRLTHLERDILVKWHEDNKGAYPDYDNRKALSKQTGLSTRQIQVWFHNHRRKLKNERSLLVESQEIERQINQF